jgi:hypothetical protein
MSQYTKLSQDLTEQASINEMLHLQVEERLDELLAAFWEMKPMLRFVDTLELTTDSMTSWLKRHRVKED